MANILRYKPADDAFDDLFRGFFMRPMSFDGPQQDVQIKVDVNEVDWKDRLEKLFKNFAPSEPSPPSGVET